jgi:glycosyltransferase involved in cell wall biosynthesis
MKICIITPNFLPKTGGTEIQTYHLAKKLISKGHDVFVITKRANIKDKERELIDGIKTIRININKVPILGQLSFYLGCLNEVKRIKPDVLHEQLISGASVFINKFIKIPFLVWTRGNDINSVEKLYRMFVLPKSLKKANIVVSQTSVAKKEILKVSKRHDVDVIPNFILEELYPEKEIKLDYYNKNDFVISTLCRLDKEKGVQDVLRAIKRIKDSDEISNLKYIILGDGAYRKELENLSKDLGLDNVFFLGKTKQKDALEILKSTDAFVFPSYSEGFPNVLLEAMMSSLPIITADFDGVNDIITNYENGLIFEKKNSEALSKQIQELYSNKKLREDIVTNNNNKLEDYREDIIVEKVEKLYDELYNDLR